MNERFKELAAEAKEYAKGFNLQHEVFDRKFAELIIEEAAKAHLCDTDGVRGKYSDSDRYYFESLMKKQLGLE